jgi:hypothetical protein
VDEAENTRGKEIECVNANEKDGSRCSGHRNSKCTEQQEQTCACAEKKRQDRKRMGEKTRVKRSEAEHLSSEDPCVNASRVPELIVRNPLVLTLEQTRV